MAYTFMKAQGGHIGKSLCEEDRLEMAIDVLKKQQIKVFVFICQAILLLQTILITMLINLLHHQTAFLMDGWV